VYSFHRELRSSSEKIINPDRVSWPSPLAGQTDLDWGNDSKGQLSVEASGEDTGEVCQYTTLFLTNSSSCGETNLVVTSLDHKMKL
jgi:hypothetical protein